MSIASYLSERLKCDVCGCIWTRGACLPDADGVPRCAVATCRGRMRLIPGERERAESRP